MKHLLGDLLFLARTDDASALSRSEKSDVRIDQLLQQLAEPLLAVAPTKKISFQIDIAPEMMMIHVVNLPNVCY